MSRRDASTRRDFLLGMFRRMAEPAAQVLEPFADQVLSQPRPKKEPGVVRRLLRPPGALPEADFLEHCERSNRCVEVCPAGAIRRWEGIDERLHGTPFLAPNLQACLVCNDLACMSACPSGALQQVPREEIRIGLAVVDQRVCARSRGEGCRECVDRCPIGANAIHLDPGGQVVVRREACIGCGICQQFCPEHPKAITVWPQG